MGKLNVFEIVLSNQQGVYFAGQTLQGHVIIELNEPVKLKGIRLTYRGRAFVHWTEQLMRGPGESRFREIRHHSATEEYFDLSQALIPRGSSNGGDDKKILAPGHYTYPFQLELPANLPSSFEGQYGYLRYWVKATMEKPWKNDYATKKVFTVICPMDLNREASASTSPQSQKQKRLCCICCRSGPVSAVLSVQQKGFVPGETIKINAEVTNMSSRKMGGSSVELKMTTLFHSSTKTRAITQQVAKLKRGPIAAGDSDLWEGEKLLIPPLPPSFLLGCSIIDVKYILELRVDPVGPAFDLSVPFEILVGTIPIRAAVQRYLRNSQIPPAAARPPQPLYPNLGAAYRPSRSPSPLYSPASPGLPASQPSSPGSVFSYGQHGAGYGLPQNQGYGQPNAHNHLHGQGYASAQSNFYNQGQGYGQGQGHGYGQDQNYGYGQPPGYHQLHEAVDGRGHYGQGADHSRGASADVMADPAYMPSPGFAEYIFGQRCVRDDDDEESTRGDMYFCPLYVFYDFESKTDKPTRTVRIAS